MIEIKNHNHALEIVGGIKHGTHAATITNSNGSKEDINVLVVGRWGGDYLMYKASCPNPVMGLFTCSAGKVKFC